MMGIIRMAGAVRANDAPKAGRSSMHETNSNE
jgi:hypothetical protein